MSASFEETTIAGLIAEFYQKVYDAAFASLTEAQRTFMTTMYHDNRSDQDRLLSEEQVKSGDEAMREAEDRVERIILTDATVWLESANHLDAETSKKFADFLTNNLEDHVDDE